MSIRIILFIILLNYIYENLAYANIPFFLDGARPAGIGDAFTAIPNDENAIFHNPAGLAYVKKKISAYQPLPQDYCDKRIFISYIQPTSKFTFGISGSVREKGDDEFGIQTMRGILYWKDTER